LAANLIAASLKSIALKLSALWQQFMTRGDTIITAMTRIHAAGLDSTIWPEALSLVTNLIGGQGASLEFLDRSSLRPRDMYAHRMPDVGGSYVEYYAPQSPRLAYGVRQPAGAICYDALCINEAEMNAHPFYAEFLAPLDMRYFVGAIISTSPRELVVSAVQLSAAQGHPDPTKIQMMEHFVPHIQQAADVMRRLGNLSNVGQSIEDILNWLTDGVLKISAGGSVRYANLAAQKIFRRNDGIATRRGYVEFLSAQASAKFAEALRAVAQLRDGDITLMNNADFIAETRSGSPPFSISIRPALAPKDLSEDVLALMFIHDPLTRDAGAAELFRQAFGLTPAEADVANGLRSGLSADGYARSRKISQNTVYTHIRRIKEKVGSTRMTELIRKLNDLQIIASRRRS
jgi:DNA-binding CsgD family transcriptional regulator